VSQPVKTLDALSRLSRRTSSGFGKELGLGRVGFKVSKKDGGILLHSRFEKSALPFEKPAASSSNETPALGFVLERVVVKVQDIHESPGQICE
jgi:hypothetical protein